MSAKLPEFTDKQYPPDLELRLLQIVHCHGERTPVRRRLENLFPPVWNLCEANKAMFASIAQFDKQNVQGLRPIHVERLVENNGAEKPGACYYGQLTNLGRLRMTGLGQRLREVYIDKLKFLPDMFDEDTVYVRSTDYPRTQESVQQLIAGGLYPKGKRSENFVLKLRIRDPRDDNMFPNPNCFKLRALAKEFTKTVADMTKDQCKSLAQKLKNYVQDVSLYSHPSANGILDTLVSAKVHKFHLPSDIDDDTLFELEKVVVKEWFYGATVSNEVRRLALGRLMGEIQDRMVRKQEGKDAKDEERLKLAVYSGHDTTIAPLLIILNAFDERWPPFGSAILFELFKEKQGKEHYVRVRYNENTLELPGCAGKGQHKEGDKSLCTLDAFRKIVKDQIPTDWEKECSI
ncbi:unnamed protein product [Rhizopus microsporus]